MNRKILLMLVAAILTIGMLGCRRESPTAKKGGAPAGGPAGTAKQGTQPGTTKTPGATPEAPSEVGKAAGQAMAQQKQEFIASAEKSLNNLEQQAQALEKQAQVPAQDQDKVTQLRQQLQQQIANARQTLNKLRDASADAWRDMTVAVNDSIQNAQGTYKELQSITQGQRQVTQQQP
jgi:hypothetical protein